MTNEESIQYMYQEVCHSCGTLLMLPQECQNLCWRCREKKSMRKVYNVTMIVNPEEKQYMNRIDLGAFPSRTTALHAVQLYRARNEVDWAAELECFGDVETV